jgi:hypothetical protein
VPTEPFPSDAQVLIQQGNLVSVKVVRGEPIKIFVVGREQASVDLSSLNWDVQFDPSDFSLSLRSLRTKKSPKILSFKKENNYYVISNPSFDDKVFTLEVTTKTKGKKEVFKFKVDNTQK